MKSEYLENLRDAVAALHECACFHSATSHVIETFEGKQIWAGDVETFTLTGHATADEAFAWAFDNGEQPQYIAVLRFPPINTPLDAVKAAIASGNFR
jgi:hypothetical protein